MERHLACDVPNSSVQTTQYHTLHSFLVILYLQKVYWRYRRQTKKTMASPFTFQLWKQWMTPTSKRSIGYLASTCTNQSTRNDNPYSKYEYERFVLWCYPDVVVRETVSSLCFAEALGLVSNTRTEQGSATVSVNDPDSTSEIILTVCCGTVRSVVVAPNINHANASWMSHAGVSLATNLKVASLAHRSLVFLCQLSTFFIFVLDVSIL